MRHLKHDNSQVWILTGIGKKQKFVDVTKMYEHFGLFLYMNEIFSYFGF